MPNTAGVKETSIYLSKRQSEGWPGSKSILSKEGQLKRRFRRQKAAEKDRQLANQAKAYKKA